MKEKQIFKIWSPSSTGFFPMTYHEVRTGDFTRLHREMHTHPEYELIRAVRGKCTVVAEGREIALEAGAFLLLRAGVRHRFLDEACDYDIIHFELQGMLFPRCGEWEEYQLIEARLPDVDVFDERSAVASELRTLFALAAKRPPFFEMEFRGELFRLFAHRARHHLADSPRSLLKPRDLRLYRVLDYMQKHFSDRIRIEELAAVGGLSPNYFMRCFRADFNTTPMGYLTKLRLENASRVLADTDMAIIDVALSVGYGDVSNFIRAFEKIYGMTPRKFRLKQKRDRKKPPRTYAKK